jgi:hypothetical protein
MDGAAGLVGFAFISVGVALYKGFAKLLLELVLIHALGDYCFAIGLVFGRRELLAFGDVRLALVEAGGVALAGDHVGRSVLGIGEVVPAWGLPVGAVARVCCGSGCITVPPSPLSIFCIIFETKHLDLWPICKILKTNGIICKIFQTKDLWVIWSGGMHNPVARGFCFAWFDYTCDVKRF